MAGPNTAEALARWAQDYRPDEEDLALARRSLLDTLAVTVAARDEPLASLDLAAAERWAAVAHVLDYDDLHLESTTHVSVVCVPAVLRCGGDARAYLAAAGVMARLGTALGWPHYARGWHATCTAGAPAAAVAGAVAMGADVDTTARAIALAVPGAGGVQQAFGTAGKALQVGFAVGAGLRAARLAAAGASADPAVLDTWLRLVGGDPGRLRLAGPVVPGGLAVKLYPCCYALQRPIAAVRELAVEPSAVERVVLRTPASTLAPLVHSVPRTGLEGKFSLEYAVAATLLDGRPGLASFTDAAVRRPEVAKLLPKVRITPLAGGDGLLAGELEVELVRTDGTCWVARVGDPPGSPNRPATAAQLVAKIRDCAGELAPALHEATWESAPALLREYLAPGCSPGQLVVDGSR